MNTPPNLGGVFASETQYLFGGDLMTIGSFLWYFLPITLILSFLLMAVFCLTNNGKISEPITNGVGFRITKARRMHFSVRITKKQLAAAWLLGASVGLINAFTPALNAATIGWSVVFFAGIIIINLGILYYALVEIESIKESIFLALAFVPIFLVMMSTAFRFAELLTNDACATSILTTVPLLLFVFSLFFLLANGFYFRFQEVYAPCLEDSDEVAAAKASKSKGYRIAAWTVMIACTVILICIFFGSINFNTAGASATESSYAEIQDSDVSAGVELTEYETYLVDLQRVETLSDLEFNQILVDSGLYNATINRNSLPSMKSERLFEDAISIPLEGIDAETYKESLMDELRNPIWLCARFERLAEIELEDGKLTKFCPAIENYIQLFNEHGVTYFVSNEYNNNELRLTTEYLRYAVIGELLFDCTDVSIEEDVTTQYVWRLDETGVYTETGEFDLSKIRTEKQVYVESSEYNDVLVVKHMTKSTDEVLYCEYFDIYDRAPVVLAVSDEGTGSSDGKSPKKDDPSPSPSPTPDPDPDPDPDPVYHKDKTQGLQGDLVAPNDDPGPGEDTNNGVGALYSTKDKATNSNHMTYDQYKSKIDDLKQANQSNDNNTPSTKTDAKVDSNADKDQGYGTIDDPTSVTPTAKTADGSDINNQPAGAWGGPAD